MAGNKEYNTKQPEMKHTEKRNDTRISERDETEKIHQVSFIRFDGHIKVLTDIYSETSKCINLWCGLHHLKSSKELAQNWEK